MRNRRPAAKRDLLAWLTTYSDIITLLMTFFVLLMTFSTDETEMYGPMQQTAFGKAISDGVAGRETTGPDRTSRIVRVRPPASRQFLTGSEIQPLWTDPATDRIEAALDVQEDSEQFPFRTGHTIEIPLAFAVSADGEVLPRGEQLLRSLAVQLRRLPVETTFQIAEVGAVRDVSALAVRLAEMNGVHPWQVAVSVVDDPSFQPSRFRIAIDWNATGDKR